MQICKNFNQLSDEPFSILLWQCLVINGVGLCVAFLALQVLVEAFTSDMLHDDVNVLIGFKGL